MTIQKANRIRDSRALQALLAAAIFVLGTTAHAQGAPSKEQMQQMAGAAGPMMACFAAIDPKQLEALGTRAEAGQNRLRQLCRAGQRDAAQREAMGLAKEFSASPEFQAVRKCGTAAMGMLPGFLNEMSSGDTGQTARHACDTL